MLCCGAVLFIDGRQLRLIGVRVREAPAQSDALRELGAADPRHAKRLCGEKDALQRSQLFNEPLVLGAVGVDRVPLDGFRVGQTRRSGPRETLRELLSVGREA